MAFASVPSSKLIGDGYDHAYKGTFVDLFDDGMSKIEAGNP